MSIIREGTDWFQIDLLKRKGVFIDKELKIQLRRYLWDQIYLKIRNRKAIWQLKRAMKKGQNASKRCLVLREKH